MTQEPLINRRTIGTYLNFKNPWAWVVVAALVGAAIIFGRAP